MIHDCLGHVPPLVNHDYAALLTLIGKAAVSVATGDQVLALKRLSWFSIEFGLIDEDGHDQGVRRRHPVVHGRDPVLALGHVERRPFVTDEVIATDYDASRMQELLFVDPVVPVPETGSGEPGAAVRRGRLITYVDHRDTKNTEDAQRLNLATVGYTQRLGSSGRCQACPPCVFVFPVPLWLTYVIYSYRNASMGSRREALKAGHIPNEMPIVAEKPMPRANDHHGSEMGKSVSTCTR